MGQLNFREGSLRISLAIIGSLIFALIASATIIPDDTTIVGDLTVQSTDGIDVNPGSDIDADLISIGVTGSPKIKWNETQDAIQFIEKLILGTNAILTKTVNGSSYTSKMSLDTDTTTDSGGIDITRHGSSNASYGSISLLRSRGTHASEAIVQSGDLISSIVGLGFDGVDYEPVGSIEMYSDGTPGSNDMPGRIDFKTVSDGSRVLNQVMRLGNRRDVMIGTTTSEASSILEVQSVTKGSRPSPRMSQTQRNDILSPATGLTVYNNDFNTYDFYNGTGWINLLDTATVQEFSGKTVTDSLKFKESGGGSNFTAFQAPASLTGDVTFTLPDGDGTSGQALKTDGAGTLSWGNASGGGGGINYIENPDAETDTTGYATYADVAGTDPVNGTGGSANVTWTRTTSTPLRATGSFLLTKDAANRQGQGASYDFTIAEADKAKVLNINFEYIVGSGTFVAGTSSTSSDVTVWIYDVTNSTLIQPSSFKLFSNSSTISDKFSGTFQTASNSTSYRLIFHVGSTSASAYTIKIDDIDVGPSNYIFGTPITDWQSYTPTGSLTTNVTYTGKWRRVGDNLEATALVAFSGANTQGSVSINLPSGLVIDTNKLLTSVGSDKEAIGQTLVRDEGTDSLTGTVMVSSSTAVLATVDTTAGTYAGRRVINTNTNLPITFANTDSIGIEYSVPILGWSSSVQMSDKADTRVLSVIGEHHSQALTATATKVSLGTKTQDTHGAFDFTTNYRFTAPTSGTFEWFSAVSLSVSGASGIANFSLKKNGSTELQNQYIPMFSGTLSGGTVSFKFTAVAGDYFEVWCEPQYTVTINHIYFSIERLSGPSAIAATESVNARYSTNAAQSVSNATLTIINFEDSSFDSHGSVTTGASWRFTAPTSGTFDVFAQIMTTDTGNFGGTEYLELRLHKNGSVTPYSGYLEANFTGSTVNNSVKLSDSIKLLAGEYIDIRMYQTSGGSVPLVNDGTYNFVNIKRIGN